MPCGPANGAMQSLSEFDMREPGKTKENFLRIYLRVG